MHFIVRSPLFIFCIVIMTFCLGGLYVLFEHHVVDLSVLELYNPGKPSILLDDEGNEWGRFELDRREPVTLEHIPRHLIHAFIAAEDWQFFSHPGVSFKGIVRSLLVNIYRGKRVQGASTITQQLVKLLFFNNKKTFKRKIKEQFYALLVERQFTKEQILETYLNHVELGYGIYGVEAASQRFWGKSVSEISLDEAATLAGIVKATTTYYPPLCPLSAQRRRNTILYSMQKLGFITSEACRSAISKPVVTLPAQHNHCAPYVKEALRLQLEECVGKQKLYAGGLRIQTTINRHIQKTAETIFAEKMANLRLQYPDLEGALISIDVKTGAIKALIGGTDFAASPYNRALQARRQMASIFKPFIYAAALQRGVVLTNQETDAPLTIALDNGTLWQPNNNTMDFEGEMTLARALSVSNNIIAIKTLLNIGYDPVIALVKKCRLTGPFYRYPSLALGCVDATLKEVVGAFNIFANNGVYVEPHLITWVKDQWGKKVYKEEVEREDVLSPRMSAQIARVLSWGITRFKQRIGETDFAVESFGKTGTTNDCRTSRFCGSTPELTTGIYVGNDDNRSMGKNVYGVGTAFPIWFEFNKALSCKKKKFSHDPSLREVIIDIYTGKQTTTDVFARTAKMLL